MAEILKYVLLLWGGWALFNAFVILNTRHRAERAGIDVYVTGLWCPHVHVSQTVIDQLTPIELDAVIAHELGHVAHGHLWKNFFIAILLPFYRSSALAVRQELEADRFVMEQGQVKGLALASALRKLSMHPFDRVRATMIEKAFHVGVKLTA